MLIILVRYVNRGRYETGASEYHLWPLYLTLDFRTLINILGRHRIFRY